MFLIFPHLTLGSAEIHAEGQSNFTLGVRKQQFRLRFKTYILT